MTRYFIRHPVTMWMIFVAFLLLGVYSIPHLRIEAVPEVDLPTLTVQTTWSSASPLAVQRSITIPIEEAVQKLRGVQKIKSISSAGRSQVEVSFRRNTNLEFARVELNEQLGSVRRTLPPNAGQPYVVPYVPEEFKTDAFFTFGIESSLDPNQLREMAEDWVVPRLLAIEGIADATVMGGARRLIKVVLDRHKLDMYGISPDDVLGAIERLDDVAGAGAVYRYGRRSFVSVRSSADIRRIKNAVVAMRGDKLFRLDMLGEVRLAHEDPVYFVRADGKNVVRVSVEKRSGTNTISVSKALRKALPEIERAVPFDVKFHVDDDQGEELEQKLDDLVLRSFVILGLLFVLLIATLRRVRLTLIVTGSIIFSVLISLSLFYFFGISVNFITISGLTVCFGMILDNSILVLDAIHRRAAAMEKAGEAGLSMRTKLKVALETVAGGTEEVFFPILATTLTTMVAFVSFIFLSGRLALYYIPLAVSVATALGASLFVAFGWVPVVVHDWWARPLVKRTGDGPNEITDPAELAPYVEDLPDLEARPPFIERVFDRLQRFWFIMVPALCVLLVWGWHVYDTKVIKGGFWRMPDKEQLIVYLEMPSGTDIELTSETFLAFERALQPIPNGARMRSQVWGNQAFMTIEFSDSLKRTEIPMYYRALLTEQADQLGGSSIFISGFSDTPYIKGTFQGSALNSLIKITGYNSKRLKAICERTLNQIRQNRRVRNARITTGARFTRAFQDEIVINLDRYKLAANALSAAQVVRHIQRLLGVDIPWMMQVEGERQRIQLSFSDSDSLEYDAALKTLIRNQRGEWVRLGDLVQAEIRPLTGTIVRENQKYSSYINWEYIGTEAMRQSFIKHVLAGLTLPYGYEAEEAKREFFTKQEEEELALTIVLAIAFIFMVLAALFESISLPLLVLLSLPMSMVGVFLAFWWTESTFDSSARIGLVLLFGIVVNNAILLVSRFRTEAAGILKIKLGRDPGAHAALFPRTRKQVGGIDMALLPAGERIALLRRAVARATHIRLRSILLTSSTTIVGLAPLLFHFGETKDKDIWENLALASIGGIAASTVLIVLTIPPLYYFCVRTAWVLRKLASRLLRRLQRYSRPARPA
jgi:HAE1 family hydrophobic/amphiphilic exporter-1